MTQIMCTQGNLKKQHDTAPGPPSFLSSRPLWPGRVESGHLGRTHVPRPLVIALWMVPPNLSPPLSAGSGRKWAFSKQNERERETELMAERSLCKVPLKALFVNWSVLDSQRCVSFSYTAQSFSHICLFFFRFFSIKITISYWLIS